MTSELQALIFDFDGLILDTESSLVAAWQEIFDEYDLKISLSKWARMLGQSSDPVQAYEYLERKIGFGVDRHALKERRVERELAILAGQEAMPGVAALIYEARAAGLSLAVGSSSEHEWVDGHLERLGLRDLFDVVVCAEDVLQTKPAPDIYLQVLQMLGVGSDTSVALEDSEHGVSAARAAGLFCIAVPNAITRAARFDHAQVVLQTLKDVGLNDIERFISGAS